MKGGVHSPLSFCFVQACTTFLVRRVNMASRGSIWGSMAEP